ncbi:MAG: hypothetical protein ACUVTF_06785, partial [bacterium]
MNKLRKNLMRLFLIVAIPILTNIVWAQQNEIKDTLQQKSKVITSQTSIPSGSNIRMEDIVREAQRSLDRSINILNVVATLIGVLVGLLTLIIV